MKRATLEATEDNILNSIKENTYNRNADVRDFVEALDTIEGNMFISLDGQWGEGKTFYVRQIEKTLEYVTKRTWGEESEVDELKPYFENTVLNSIDLKQSYLPIYYNAWLYDNHNDPLMSLIYTIVKKTEQYIGTTLDKPKKEILKDTISSLTVSLNLGLVQVSASGEKIKDALAIEDILENIKTAEEIRELVKNILDNVIVEKANRLVIFIDELDRCRPSYAIEMLERIKHYFRDDRIIFIASVNKEQLVHTISRYYGYGFDSTGYLNKFFDLNVHIPSQNFADMLFGIYNNQQYHLTKISESLNEYYKLSLRDGLIFKQKISMLPFSLVNDRTALGCCLSLFVPVIVILDIRDEDEKIKFLNGSSDILEKLCKDIAAIQDMVCRFGSDGSNEGKIANGFKEIKAVYDYAFKNSRKEETNRIVWEISSDIKSTCMKLCNGFVR